MARTVFRPQLIEFLVAHEGLIVHLDAMMRALPDGASPSSVRSAMRKIVDEGTFQITTLAAGNSWRIESVTAAGHAVLGNSVRLPARPLTDSVGPFVKLGEMADGSMLVRHDATSELYTLKRL